MTDHDEEPTWRPVRDVGMMTTVVAEQLAHSKEMLEMFEQARPDRPNARVLDDHTVAETRRVYGQMAADYEELFGEQGRRWQALTLGKATRRLVDAYVAVVDEHRQVLADILALNEQIAEWTIEKVMATGDAELGLRSLAMTLGAQHGAGSPGPYGPFGGTGRAPRP
ncbi:hypothetical protein [Actinomadura sp. 6N118]|uniref:hypothetical protein n=1 Tax=Actinomadura sp. 6N118 TaxID=3375151 RepID=UPI0037969BAD